MTAIEPALQYPGISAAAFAHPADRAATAALHSVPLLDRVVKRFSEFSSEKRLRQLFLGQAVRLGEDQLPAVWAMQRAAAHTFDVERCPLLYVTQQPVSNAVTFGTHEPVTLVASALVAGSSEIELRSVLAHEMGHVLADHVALTQTFEMVRQIVQRVLRIQPIAGVPMLGLYYALLEWSRAAELTADRAAALGVADPLVVCGALMRVAGGPLPELNLDAFVRQATEYAGEDDPFNRWSRFFDEITADHPFPVRRVRELSAWVASGEYDRLRAGQYLHRGQEPPASEEYDAAYAYYRRRFSTVVERAGQGITSVFSKVSSWLDRVDEDEAAGADGADDE